MNARSLFLVLLVALGAPLACGTLTGCKKKPKPFPPAPQLLSTATTEGAALGPADAGMVPVGIMTATPNSLPTPADPLSPAERAASDQTTNMMRDVDLMVKKGVLTNPAKPDDGDATSKCASIEEARAPLDAVSDPDTKKLVAESRRLCSLEVPILSADHSLKQVTISPSQASRQLMCKFALKDIEKARTAKASDRRVRDLDARFTRACR